MCMHPEYVPGRGPRTSQTAEDLKSSGDSGEEVAQVSLKAGEARLEDRGHMSDASTSIGDK